MHVRDNCAVIHLRMLYLTVLLVICNSVCIYYRVSPAPDKDDEVEKDCVWLGPIENFYISGNDAKTLYTISLEDCKKACEDETSFDCISFDYYVSVKYCYLSKIDRHDVTLSSSTAYHYYERRCEGGFRYLHMYLQHTCKLNIQFCRSMLIKANILL